MYQNTINYRVREIAYAMGLVVLVKKMSVLTLKHDETVIRPTILYTFIDLMYALLASFTILTHDQRDEEKGRRI
jgi:KaiC/GvpD/RAD55 family RecA-like ATPase